MLSCELIYIIFYTVPQVSNGGGHLQFPRWRCIPWVPSEVVSGIQSLLNTGTEKLHLQRKNSLYFTEKRKRLREIVSNYSIQLLSAFK